MVLIDGCYALAALVLWPWVLYRRIVQGRYRSGWRERFGAVPARYDHRPCVWIHAVSMGEVNAMRTLVTELEQTLPQVEVVISTTTDTGMARAKKLFGENHRVFFFPFDFSWAMRRAFRRLRPSLCILMELELWPQFGAIAALRSVPVVIANGRISGDKGFPRYQRVGWLVRGMFRRLSLVLAQDATYAGRFESLGVPRERIVVAGSLKYDTADVADQVEGAEVLAERVGLSLSPDEPVWVAGSTGPEEEAILLRVYRQLRESPDTAGLRLVIVPRKPERFDEVAGLIQAAGFPLLRYAEVKDGGQPGDRRGNEVDEEASNEAGEKGGGPGSAPRGDDVVILGDTMGDLRRFYSLASVVFVGRTLVPMGGSDMMEVAALGKPVIVGPFTDNFAQVMEVLQRADAVTVVQDEAALSRAVREFLLNLAEAEAMGRRGRSVIVEQRGATRRTVEAVLPLLTGADGLGQAEISARAVS